LRTDRQTDTETDKQIDANTDRQIERGNDRYDTVNLNFAKEPKH
jgi:hypothetical protein